MIRINKLLVLLFLLLPITGHSEPTNLVNGENDRVDDLVFYKTGSEILTINEYIIRYEVFYSSKLRSNSPYNPEFVRQILVESTRLLFSFLRYKNINVYSECRYMDLDIHHITMDILNDRTRFDLWPIENRVSPNSNMRIWALYDPIKDDHSISAIYLTDHGGYNEGSLAHEVSHYWFDRLCVYHQWTSGTEDFAVQFQSYYARNK